MTESSVKPLETSTTRIVVIVAMGCLAIAPVACVAFMTGIVSPASYTAIHLTTGIAGAVGFWVYVRLLRRARVVAANMSILRIGLERFATGDLRERIPPMANHAQLEPMRRSVNGLAVMITGIVGEMSLGRTAMNRTLEELTSRIEKLHPQAQGCHDLIVSIHREIENAAIPHSEKLRGMCEELAKRSRMVENTLGCLEEYSVRVRWAKQSFDAELAEIRLREPRAQWRPEYSVGITDLDEQHKVILHLIDRLSDIGENDGSGEAIANVFRQLIVYVHSHFCEEEELMETMRYTDTDTHKSLHRAFEKEIEEMFRSYTDGASANGPNALLTVLQHWLVHHIQISDKAFGDFAANQNATIGPMTDFKKRNGI